MVALLVPVRLTVEMPDPDVAASRFEGIARILADKAGATLAEARQVGETEFEAKLMVEAPDSGFAMILLRLHLMGLKGMKIAELERWPEPAH